MIATASQASLATAPAPGGFHVMGGGLAGWLTAAVLARALGPDHGVTLSETAAPGATPAAVVLGPEALARLDRLGWDEATLAADGAGLPLLGTVLAPGQGAPRFISHAPLGAPWGSVAFDHVLARLRQAGDAVAGANYSFNALCAQAGRYAPPRPGLPAVAETLLAGLALDGPRWAARLRAQALAAGVLIRGEAPADALLQLDCRVDGDPGQVLPRAPGQAPALFTLLERDSAPDAARWRLRVPLVQGTAVIGGAIPQTAPATTPPWHAGRLDLTAGWRGFAPAVALGPELLLAALERLLGLLPTDPEAEAEAGEFNRLTMLEHEACATWCDQLLGPGDAPATVRLRTIYAATGRVVLGDAAPRSEADWINLFEAQGVIPQHPDAQLAAVPLDDLRAHCARIREIMLRALAQIPPVAGGRA